MESALCSTRQGEAMKERGAIISSRGWDMNDFVMVRFIRGAMSKESLKGLGVTNGAMGKCMKDNGLQV